jgi:hypothetical protein
MTEKDIYAAPDTQPQQRPLAEQVLSEQSMIGIVIGSLSAGIPSMMLYVIIVSMYAFPVAAYILPGLIIGFTARFCGRGIEFRFRLVCGLITFALLLVVNYFITYPSGIILSLPSVFLAIILAKRKLTREQNSALVRYKALKFH